MKRHAKKTDMPIQPEGDETVLSSTTLKQHNKNASEENQESTSSWVLDSNTVSPTQDDPQPSTSGPTNIFHRPTALVDATHRERKTDLEEKDHKLASTSSRYRYQRLQSLPCEQPSNEHPELKPSCARYLPSNHDDIAFAKISLAELKMAKDPEAASSGLTINEIRARTSLIATDTVLSKTSDVLPKQSTTDETELLAKLESEGADAASELVADPDEEENQDELGETLGGLSEKTDRTKTGGKSTFKGLLGVAKWRMKSKKHGIKGMQSIAKDEAHQRFITRNIERTAVEMPLPLQKLILEETYQILKLTVKDYIKVLGPKDPLTRSAIDKLDERVHALRMCESL